MILNLRVWKGDPGIAYVVAAALERRFPYRFEVRSVADDGSEVRADVFYGPYDLVTFTEEEARMREYAAKAAEGKL